MRIGVLIRLACILVIADLLTYCREQDPDFANIVQRQDTLTIAQVRSFSMVSLPSSVQVTDPGQEGIYKLVASDHSTADDTGSILVTASGRRYKRDYSGPASAAWFGVLPSATDIGPALQAAVNAAQVVVIPDGAYTQQTAVKLRSGLTLRGSPGKVIITLPQSYIALVSPTNGNETGVPLENVTIDGLSWKLTTRQTASYGAVIYIAGPSVSKLTIQNCSSTDVAAKDSTNWLTVLVPLGKTANKIIVQNNAIQAKRIGCEMFNHDNIGIYAGKNITVSGNDFRNCWFGVSLSGPLDSLTVDNNHLTDCRLYGVEIAGAARNVTLTNNRFEGVFDKLIGSSDGNGNGSVVGGMVVTGNTTVGLCTGGSSFLMGGYQVR